MKVCGQQETKVTLLIHGRERSFSERELIAILEKHFPNEATEQKTTVKWWLVRPFENDWFEVNPLAIDQSLFQTKREDESQETTRKLILEAFAEVKNNPEKYGRKFKTMMYTKKCKLDGVTVEELMELACQVGDHNADWVEQALEWAQRISNGASWKILCNDADTAEWFRLVEWKDGHAHLVGGSRRGYNTLPASCIHDRYFWSFNKVYFTVPLAVLYEE